MHALQREKEAAAKEKEDACTAAKAELASKIKALERQSSDLNAEITALQEERSKLETQLASAGATVSEHAELAERNAKLLKERLWFEKRYVMSENYKHDMEEAMESITKERDQLQAAVTRLEEAVMSKDVGVGGSSEAQRAVVDQLRQALSESQNNTRQAESHVRSEQTKNATLESQIQAIKEENRAIQDELEKHLRDSSDYLQTIQDLKNTLASKDVRIHDLQTSYQATRDSVIALNASHEKALATKDAEALQAKAVADAAYSKLQMEYLEMKTRMEQEISVLHQQNQELEHQLAEATVFTGGALVPAKKAMGMQAEKPGVSSGPPERYEEGGAPAKKSLGMQGEKPGVSSGPPGRYGDDDEEEEKAAPPKRAGPAQDKPGVSSGAPAGGSGGNSGSGAQQGANNSSVDDEDDEYSAAPPLRKGGPQQDKPGVSSGAPGREDSYPSSSGATQQQQRAAGTGAPGEDDRYASPPQQKAAPSQDRPGQSSGPGGAPGSPSNQQPQQQGPLRRAPPQQDRPGQSTGAPGSQAAAADGGGYVRMDDPEDHNAQYRTPQRAGPNQDRPGQSSGADANAPGEQLQQQQYGDEYGTPGAARPQRRGPMQDKPGVSAGAGGDGGQYGSNGAQSQASAQELAAALAQRNRDFEHLNSQFQALLVEHQALTAAAEQRRATQQQGNNGSNASSNGAAGSLSMDKNNALNPASVSATSFFIPSNLHALSNGELVQLLVSLKSTLLALQDANDTLSSRAFMAAHTITRLEHSAIRTSELQKYILSQESIWLFKQQTLQRDCILLRNERDEIIRKLLSESSDELLKQLVARVENESKVQADQLAARDAELDSLHKSYRELEVYQRSKEAEHAETVHAIEAQCVARTEQLKNAHAEQVRALELKCERIFVAGGSDAMVLRGETERAYEARLAQQLAFWQEKESAWLAEKTLILKEWSKEEALWSAEKDSFEAMRAKLSLQRTQLDEENNKIWSLKLAEKVRESEKREGSGRRAARAPHACAQRYLWTLTTLCPLFPLSVCVVCGLGIRLGLQARGDVPSPSRL